MKIKCGKLYSYYDKITIWNKPPQFFLNTNDNPARLSFVPKGNLFVVLEIINPSYPNNQPWIITKILTNDGIIGWSQLYANYLYPPQKDKS
jgi:hypothetical protein